MRHEERRDFDILARNHWKYSTRCSFSRKACARSGSPAAHQSPSIQAIREAHAPGISTCVDIQPTAYPAELINVVELLRADVDAWKIGSPPPGEPPPKAIIAGRPGFVDADTALAHLRRMVERGLSDKLRRWTT